MTSVQSIDLTYQKVDDEDIVYEDFIAQTPEELVAAKRKKWFGFAAILTLTVIAIICGILLVANIYISNSITLYKYPLPESYTTLDQDLPGRCLDLTEPGYYFRGATDNEHDKHFVMYMGKGLSAFDNKTIDFLASSERSANMNATMEYEGIYSQDSPFAGWNLMAADYCSRDSYVGNMSYNDPESVTAGWHFGGYTLFWANFEAMLNDQGMDEATIIVVAGSETASEGFFHHIDDLVELLAVRAPNAEVKFLMDTAWRIFGLENSFADSTEEGTKYDGTGAADQGYEETVYVRKWDGWRPVYHQGCMDSLESKDQYLCGYTGTYLYPVMTTRDIHIHFNQYDLLYAYTSAIPIDYEWNWDNATEEFSNYLADEYVASVATTDEETSFSAPTCRESMSLMYEIAFFAENMEDPWYSEDWSRSMVDIYYKYATENEIYRQYDDCGGVNCNPTCLSTTEILEYFGIAL